MRVGSPEEAVAAALRRSPVLGAAFEGLAFRVALREFRRVHADEPLFSAIRRSKDPSVFAVLLEDAAALTGLGIAAIGLGLAAWLDMPELDGAASIAIAIAISLLLVLTAIFLANETRSLLTGESASSHLVTDGAAHRPVWRHTGLSMHLGPSEVLVAVTLDFRDDLPGVEIERAAEKLTRQVEAAHRQVTWLFLRPRCIPPVASGLENCTSQAAVVTNGIDVKVARTSSR